MLDRLKQFPWLPVFLVSFSFGFIFLFESLTLYSNNINDFWFDFYIMLTPTFIASFVIFFSVFVIMLLFYCLSVLFKKTAIFFVMLFFFYYAFLCAFVNGNFLAVFLPKLDGSEIDWSKSVPVIVHIAVLIVIAIIIVIAVMKVGTVKTLKAFFYVDLLTIVVLVVSLVTTFWTTDALKSKGVMLYSADLNLTQVSSRQNYFVILVDAIDAKVFEDILKQDNNRMSFKDFYFFPDSLSGYPFTRDSVPFIFSGIWNENNKSFEEYSTEAFDNSPLLNAVMEDEKYSSINIFDDSLIWNSKKALEFDNLYEIDRNSKIGTFIRQEAKYFLFKVLPFSFKRFSRIETMDFDLARIESSYTPFVWDDAVFYWNTLEKEAEIVDGEVFSYIHLEGGHVPFDLDKDLERIDDGGTYRQKVEATMTLLKKYLNWLKKNGVYDNSTIVILSDHGYNDSDYDFPKGRQNPLLLIKAKKEEHDEMVVSKKQISFEDLAEAFLELKNGKKGSEIFDGIPEKGRTRRFLFYVYTKEKHMEEQELNGKAWETEKLIPTGEEYDL